MLKLLGTVEAITVTETPVVIDHRQQLNLSSQLGKLVKVMWEVSNHHNCILAKP